MFFSMLQGCGDVEFRFAGDGSNWPESNGMESAARAAGGDERGIVVVHMEGPENGECFVVERRDCYWAVVGEAKMAS
jgi:hypothetical protein